MKNDFVTLETAKALKDKGFDWKCNSIITIGGTIRSYESPQDISYLTEIEGKPYEFLLPTIDLAKKWFRETKNLHIEIYRNACGYGYVIVKADNGTWMEDDNSKGPNDGGNWDTYEEALEAGLQEALKLI